MATTRMSYRTGFWSRFTTTTLRGLFWLNAFFALITILMAEQVSGGVDRPTLLVVFVALWVAAVHWNAMKLLIHLRRLEQELTEPNSSMKLMYDTAGALAVMGVLPVLALQIFIPLTSY